MKPAPQTTMSCTFYDAGSKRPLASTFFEFALTASGFSVDSRGSPQIAAVVRNFFRFAASPHSPI